MAEQTITESLRVQQLKLFLEEEGHHELFSDSHASEGESWGDCPVLAQLLASFVDGCQSHQMPHAFGLLPCIALQSHPPLPLQTTAQVANVVLGTAVLQNQKINCAVHRLLPVSTSQLLTSLQRKVTELNQEKLPSSLSKNHQCFSHEGITFSNLQVDEPSDCVEPKTSFSPIGLESSCANQPQVQEASSNNPLFPHGQQNEQVPKVSIFLESLFKLPKENNTLMPPLRKQNLSAVEIQKKPDIVLVHQSKGQNFLLPAVKSYKGQDYQQQARTGLPCTLHLDSSLPTDAEAARRCVTPCSSDVEKIKGIGPILPEKCSTPMTAVLATNLVGGQTPPVATSSSRASPSVATITSTATVIATASPTVTTPTLTAATSSLLLSHGVFTPNLGSKPVSNTLTTAALVVQRALMLYACWKERLSNLQLEAASLGPADKSFGPALMEKFGGPQQVKALATQAEALLEKALAVSALQCRSSLIRPLLEVLEYNKGRDAALARLWLFLQRHKSLPEAQRAGLRHVLAQHPLKHRLQLHILQNLQQLCPADDSVLLLTQILLDHPNAFGHHQLFWAPDGDVNTSAPVRDTSATRSKAGDTNTAAGDTSATGSETVDRSTAAGGTSATRSVTVDTNTAARSTRATRSETADTNTAAGSTSATTSETADTNTAARSTSVKRSCTTMSSSGAKLTQGFSALTQTPAHMEDATAEVSNTYTGHEEKNPAVVAMETSSTCAAAHKVEKKSKNESNAGARTKCPLQQECVVQSTVCAVRVLVRLLQFPQWHAVLRPWRLLRRAFVLLHTSWIRCWQCSGCRWSREAVASSVTVFWLSWWRQLNSPSRGSTGASNSSASSGTDSTATNCSGGRNSALTCSNSSDAGNSSVLSGTTTVASSRHDANDISTSSCTVTIASHSSAPSGTVTSAPNSSGDDSSHVFFSADSGATEHFSGSKSSTALEASSSLNSSSVAELAMHRAVVAHILCIDDDCGKWCDALRRGGWLNMAKELKDTVGAQGPFKESFTRYKRTLLYRHSMLFAGSLNAGEKTLPHVSAPEQACDTQPPRPPDMTSDSVLCKSIESFHPYLKTGLQPGSKDLVVESTVRDDHQSCNFINIDCSSTSLLDNPSAPTAAQTEALGDSSCSTVLFNDDHLLPKFHIRNESENVIVQASRRQRRTISDRFKHTGKRVKKQDSLDSGQLEDRKKASNSVAEDKSFANSSSGASKDKPMKVEDNDLGHQEVVAFSLKTKNELVTHLQHSGGVQPVSSRDGMEATCQLSPSNDSKDLCERDCSRSHFLTGWQKSCSPGTHCGIEVETEEVKEENISDGANSSLAARNNKEDSKLNNCSNSADHKRNASSKKSLLESSTNIFRPSYERCFFPVSVDDQAADSSLAKPLKQTDGPNLTILCGKRKIATEECSFSSNTDESSGMLYTEVNEIISSLKSPPATKQRKRDAQNSVSDAHSEPLSVDDKYNESLECSSNSESYPQRDVTRHLGRGAIKRKRPIGEMVPGQGANTTGVRKMEFGLVKPCFLRLHPLESHKFVTSPNP